MSKEVMEVPRNSFIDGKGELVTLDGFDKLGKRAQKNKLLQLFITTQNDMLNAYDEVNECRSKSKSLKRAMKNSEPGKKLEEINKRGSAAKKDISLKAYELKTYCKVAETLGIDIKDDIKRLKSVEVGD